MSELANASRGLYRQVCRSADAIWPNVAATDKQSVTLDSDTLAAQPMEVKVELVRRTLAHLAGGEQEITEKHYSDILQLPQNKSAQLPGGIEAHRQDTKIVFMRSPAKSIETGETAPVALKVPGKIQFGSYTIDAEIFEIEQSRFDIFKKTKTNFVEWFDFDKLKLPLEVRIRKPGDKFRPLGLKAEKKIGKFLTDAKASSQTRRKAIILADSEKIIWLCPIRISEQTKITSRTKKILQLRITQKEDAADNLSAASFNSD
jgi:tRNA(Ile)-lysidine synthase